jgi:Ca-activated chloride channel family protein
MGANYSAQPCLDANAVTAEVEVVQERRRSRSPRGAASTPVGAVELSALPGRETVLCGVKQKLHVLLQIRTGPPETARPPLSVAVVMDKSGSMRGAKLKFAQRGVRKLIKHLKPPDVLHCIAYDTHVKTVFRHGDLTEAGKEDLVQLVKGVTAGTATNLSGGLDAGFAELQDRSEPEAEPQHQAEEGCRRIFLFSDGLANQGEKNHSRILAKVDDYREHGVTVSSFGIGTDFDERLMTAIAHRGGGDYAFLESAEAIPKLVSKSVHSLLSLAGTEATLAVRGLNGAVVTKVYGDDDDAQLGAVPIGDLHAENLKQVLVEVELTPAAGPGGQVPPLQPVLEFELRYLPLNTATPASISGTASVAFTNDRASIAPEVGTVAAAVAIQQGATKDDQVLDLLAQGRIADARALKESSIEAMAEVLKTLGPNPDNREACATLARVLERARETLDAMQDNSRSRQAMEMDMRYEQTVQRAMSVCRLSRGNDSDDGNWSDNGLDEPPALQRRLSPSSPLSSGSPRRFSLVQTPFGAPGSPCLPRRPSSTSSGGSLSADSDSD